MCASLSMSSVCLPLKRFIKYVIGGEELETACYRLEKGLYFLNVKSRSRLTNLLDTFLVQ